MPCPRPVLASAAWLALALPGLHAQSVLQTFHAQPARDHFGGSVAGGFDVDGDGVPDVVLGARNASTANGVKSGRALVCSGRTGEVLHQWLGSGPHEGFGACVDFAGDADGDGFADVLVGSQPWGECASGPCLGGVARLHSGKDGRVLHTWIGAETGDLLGASVSRAGDVDGDGRPDVLLGASGADASGSSERRGQVRVHSGRDGSLIHVLHGAQPGERLGQSVTWLGDVDGDGRDDVAASGSGRGPGDDPACVRVFSGRTGGELHVLSGSRDGGRFGFQISGVGDLDRDGAGDLAIGEPAWPSLPRDGRVQVHSGRTGALLRTLECEGDDGSFGSCVSDAGDVDGDGWPDVLAAAPTGGAHWGSTRIHSGRDGALLLEIPGVTWGSVRALDSAGDFDRDGCADVVVARQDDWTFPKSSGVARVHRAERSEPRIYCSSQRDSQGCRAELEFEGTPSASSESPFVIRASGVMNNKGGLLIYGTDAQSAAAPFGTLCISSAAIKRTSALRSQGNLPPTDCSGVLEFDFNELIRARTDLLLVPNQSICAQFWYRDSGSRGGSVTSAAIQFAIAP